MVFLLSAASLTLISCNKEDISQYFREGTLQSGGLAKTSGSILVPTGLDAQHICTNSNDGYSLQTKVVGGLLWGTSSSSDSNLTLNSFSTLSTDSAALHPSCDKFIFNAFELIPSTTGGPPTESASILASTSSNPTLDCIVKVHPDNYAGKTIRIRGVSQWKGYNPLTLGMGLHFDIILNPLDISCP